jgi:hypothetical protein
MRSAGINRFVVAFDHDNEPFVVDTTNGDVFTCDQWRAFDEAYPEAQAKVDAERAIREWGLRN